MIIQVNTDSSIENDAALTAHVQTVVEKALSRFSDKVTRVEVHLHDENAHKPGDHDKRCLLEVRLAGLQPQAVTHHADSTHNALAGASDKMKNLLDSLLGKLNKR
ncbi:MAG: HPF/RaiA family ribosome-associated protein [Nitrincola sp.]|nr:HPF/RaiA family ribosome-associated protein [Nitrincola sp.]